MIAYDILAGNLYVLCATNSITVGVSDPIPL